MLFMRIVATVGCVLLTVTSLAAAGPVVPIIEAVTRGDLVSLRSLVQQHVDVNAASVDGTTALHWAANRDDLEAAGLLIRSGARVQARNRYGVTPLTLACTNGSAAMIDLLLKAGADPN